MSNVLWVETGLVVITSRGDDLESYQMSLIFFTFYEYGSITYVAGFAKIF
jgi:hypothetical protein